MAKAQAVGTDLSGGDPSGNVYFVTIPEPTFVALSNKAAERGMTAMQALAIAINDFCNKPR